MTAIVFFQTCHKVVASSQIIFESEDSLEKTEEISGRVLVGSKHKYGLPRQYYGGGGPYRIGGLPPNLQSQGTYLRLPAMKKRFQTKSNRRQNRLPYLIGSSNKVTRLGANEQIDMGGTGIGLIIDNGKKRDSRHYQNLGGRIHGSKYFGGGMNYGGYHKGIGMNPSYSAHMKGAAMGESIHGYLEHMKGLGMYSPYAAKGGMKYSPMKDLEYYKDMGLNALHSHMKHGSMSMKHRNPYGQYMPAMGPMGQHNPYYMNHRGTMGYHGMGSMGYRSGLMSHGMGAMGHGMGAMGHGMGTMGHRMGHMGHGIGSYMAMRPSHAAAFGPQRLHARTENAN